MLQEQAREDIAFIRRAIEEGGAYATACSPDMLVWGIAVAIGYLGTYGFIRGWSPIMPNALWAACIGLPWLYSLPRQLRHLIGGAPAPRGPMAQALSMLWLGCGVLLTTLAIAVVWSGEIRQRWPGGSENSRPSPGGIIPRCGCSRRPRCWHCSPDRGYTCLMRRGRLRP